MRVVADLNILASAAVSPDGVPASLLDNLIQGPHVLIVSEVMLARLAKVIERPYFSQRLTVEQRQRTLDRYRAASLVISPDSSIVGYADDAEDDRVLGTAVAGRAETIVTGDKGLLALHSFRDIAIVSAQQLVRILDRD